MRNYVIINGVNSLTIKGLAINELPPIVKAPMRVLQEEIDGRDGDIITDLGYGAYDKVMTIGLYDGYDINEIIAFFNKEGTIVFSDEADKYYNFKIIEQIDYERLIKFRTASITFHCQPFKYPLTETPVEITNEYVEAEGTDLTLTPTAEAPISIDLKGNTSQGLPSEYQAVEYIESSGTQYIDTGLKGKNAISIDTDYSITSATTWSSLLGCANGTAGNSVACVIGITKNGSINGGWYWRNTTNEQFDSNNVAQLDLKTNLKVSATSFVFKNTNGTKTYSFSEVNSFETTPNMYIFASNKNGTINDYSKIKLYYMKIFDGTTLKREYLPCYRISDNVIGLYDMVENKFYTNAGTGTFTKGSNTTLPTPDYPQEIHNVSGDNTIVVEGKNLFDIGTDLTSYFQTYSNGLTINATSVNRTTATISNNKLTINSYDTTGWTWISKWVNLNKNTDYVISGTNTQTIRVVGFDSKETGATGTLIIAKGANTQYANFNTGNYKYYCISFYPNGANDYFENIQIEKNNQLTPYTPYVSQTQEIDLRTSKNIFDINAILTGYYVNQLNGELVQSSNRISSEYISVKANTKYIFSNSNDISTNGKGIAYYNENKVFISGSVISTFTDGKFTTPANCRYLRFSYDSSGDYANLMLNEGETALPYDSYNSLELNKIGNYQDYFYKTDKWYLHKEIGKYVLTGGENETWQYNSTYTFFWTTSITNIDNQPVYTNYYLYNSSITGITGSYGCSVYQNTFRIKNTDYTQPSDLKTWLSTHNTIVYYVLNTPTDTEITDSTLLSQLEAIKNMNSYDGTTNISQENNDEPFIIKAKAMKQGSGTATITNSGNIYSKPTIDIEGTGIVDVYIGANQIFSVNVDEEVIIDSTNLEAYKTDGTLANRNVTGNIANLKLPTGNSTIKVDGDIDKATITNYTRWL